MDAVNRWGGGMMARSYYGTNSQFERWMYPLCIFSMLLARAKTVSIQINNKMQILKLYVYTDFDRYHTIRYVTYLPAV